MQAGTRYCRPCLSIANPTIASLSTISVVREVGLTPDLGPTLPAFVDDSPFAAMVRSIVPHRVTEISVRTDATGRFELGRLANVSPPVLRNPASICSAAGISFLGWMPSSVNLRAPGRIRVS